ncbi:uncharacterized protein LOC121412847 [Lytechinus variegatus]|nr:uncharacterized protein LOC121412847 [Lytechinus variegatus]
MYGNSCYYLYDLTGHLYETAELTCRDLNSHVYVPSSESEYEAVSARLLLVQYYFYGSELGLWIGCANNGNDDSFFCSDGTEIGINSDWWFNTGYITGGPDRCAAFNLKTFPSKLYKHSCENDTNAIICEDGPVQEIDDLVTTTSATTTTTTSPIESWTSYMVPCTAHHTSYTCPEIYGRYGMRFPAIHVYFADRFNIEMSEVCNRMRGIQRASAILFRQNGRFQKTFVSWRATS